MSLVNDLIRRARERPAELTIRPNQVGTVAEHILGCCARPDGQRDQIKAWLHAGKVKMLGVPIRVIGQ